MKSREAYRKQKVIAAGKRLAKFYQGYQKDLPWRKKRTNYRIFLAEMLLVRTRADVVEKLFESIYAAYPNIQTLANADEEHLSRLLRPLGLRKRVPYVIRAAQYICEIHNGKIPSNINALLKVPGLGIYTAAAIAVFAHKQDLVPADVNILRFIARLTGLEMEHKTKGSKQLIDLAPYLSKKYTGLSPENLLDFTRLTCHPRNPQFSQCPLTRQCEYYRASKK